MKTKHILGLTLGALLSTSQGMVVVVNDFEGGTFTGGGPENGGLHLLSSTNPAVKTEFDYVSGSGTATVGLGGSAGGALLTPRAAQQYDGLLDLNYQALLDAGLDTTNAVLSFDYTVNAVTTGYNGIVLVANTDGDDGNDYDQGANGIYFATGSASGTATIDFTDLIPFLDPSVNPNYSTLRFIGNKDSASTLELTIDNISITTIPEPSSALLTGLAALVLLRRRR